MAGAVLGPGKAAFMNFRTTSAFGFQSLVSEVEVEVFFAQLCPPLCDPMDCSLCPWDSLGKNTGVCSHAFLQGIFQTQGSDLCLLYLLHGREASYPLSHVGSLINWVK